MSIAQLRARYGQQIKRGSRIRYTGVPGKEHDGTIVGTYGPYLLARLPTLNVKRAVLLHPTWEITYMEANQ